MDIELRCCGPAHSPGLPYGASLSLGTATHLRLPPDLPSRAHQGYAAGKDLVLQIDALVSLVSSSLHQGLAEDSHLLAVSHAMRTHSLVPRSRLT